MAEDLVPKNIVFARRSWRLDTFALLFYLAATAMGFAWFLTKPAASAEKMPAVIIGFTLLTGALARFLIARYRSPVLIVGSGDELQFYGTVWPGYEATLSRSEIVGFGWDDCGEGDVKQGYLVIAVHPGVMGRQRGRLVWTSFGKDEIRYSYTGGDVRLSQLTDRLNEWLAQMLPA